MRNKRSTLFPKQQQMLAELGENISLAIRRRKLTMAQVAERADTCRETLASIRRGDSGVSIKYKIPAHEISTLAKAFNAAV